MGKDPSLARSDRQVDVLHLLEGGFRLSVRGRQSVEEIDVLGFERKSICPQSAAGND